jgi:hypothetical protein
MKGELSYSIVQERTIRSLCLKRFPGEASPTMPGFCRGMSIKYSFENIYSSYL